MDGQIKSGSSSRRDSDGGGASSSSSYRDGIIGGPDATIGIDSAGNDVTSNPTVHDEPCESDMARRRGRSDYCIAPSSSGDCDEDESSCRTNDDNGIGKMKNASADNTIATTMHNCDLVTFSPRYSQCPDDITPLPHSNTSSMFEETTESEEDHEQWDGSSRSKTEMPQANKSYDYEHLVCGTNTPKLGITFMGNAESNAKGTASSPGNNTASQEENSPGLWQQIHPLSENDEAEPTNCDADGASSEIGNNSISFEEKFNSEKLDVEDETLENGFYASEAKASSNACSEKNIQRDIGIEANNGIDANVNITEACKSSLRAGKATISPTSPPKIGRIILKETSPSFPRFEPVAVVAPSIVQSFSEKRNHVEQQHEVHQPSPRDSLNPSVTSSAITARVHNVSCGAKRSHPSASEGEGREDDISSRLSTSITRGQADGKRQRQQSTKVTHACVSTSPISLPQRSSELQFGFDRAHANRNDDFEESSHADHVEKENHSCPAHAFEQHRDPNEVSFGPDDNGFSGGYDSSPPTRMPLSTRSAGNQRAPFKHQDGFPSPASTVAATVQELTAPRRKMQIMHDSSDRPFPIPSGDARQSKLFEKSSAHMSSSNEGPYQSASDSAHHEAAESFERVPYPSRSNQSDDREDLQRKKSRSKKKIRKIERKLLATSKVTAVYKPSSALIPLSQRLEEPAWQFSCDQRSEQSF